MARSVLLYVLAKGKLQGRDRMITPSPHRMSGLGKPALREAAKGRDPTRLLRNGFQVLDEGPAPVLSEQRADDPLTARTILEGMTGVRVPQQRGVHQKSSR